MVNEIPLNHVSKLSVVAMKRLLLLLPVVFIVVNSCKKDGCNDPGAFNYDPEGNSADLCIYEPMQVHVETETYFGDEPLVVGKAFDIQDGRAITINYYGIYLSELSFGENGSFTRWTRDVMLLKDENRNHTGLYLRKGALDGLQFTIGVDSAVYTSDPTDTSMVPMDSPLAPQNPTMWWGWAGGYRYISLSGTVDTSALKDGSGIANFEYHVGLTPNLRTLTFQDLDLQPEGNKLGITLRLDVRKIFENVTFANELATHTSDNPALAAKIADNTANAFEIR